MLRSRNWRHPNISSQIAGGMLGDVYDLFDLLAWVDRVRDHTIAVGAQAPQDFWTLEEKREILKTGIRLFKAFKKAEGEHRKEHKIDVGREKRRAVCIWPRFSSIVVTREALTRYMCKYQAGDDVRYDCLVASRMAALHPLPASPFNQISVGLARLVPLDQGYPVWVTAKAAFGNEMGAIMDKKGDAEKKVEFKGNMNPGIVKIA